MRTWSAASRLAAKKKKKKPSKPRQHQIGTLSPCKTATIRRAAPSTSLTVAFLDFPAQTALSKIVVLLGCARGGARQCGGQQTLACRLLVREVVVVARGCGLFRFRLVVAPVVGRGGLLHHHAGAGCCVIAKVVVVAGRRCFRRRRRRQFRKRQRRWRRRSRRRSGRRNWRRQRRFGDDQRYRRLGFLQRRGRRRRRRSGNRRRDRRSSRGRRNRRSNGRCNDRRRRRRARRLCGLRRRRRHAGRRRRRRSSGGGHDSVVSLVDDRGVEAGVLELHADGTRIGADLELLEKRRVLGLVAVIAQDGRRRIDGSWRRRRRRSSGRFERSSQRSRWRWCRRCWCGGGWRGVGRCGGRKTVDGAQFRLENAHFDRQSLSTKESEVRAQNDAAWLVGALATGGRRRATFVHRPQRIC